LEVVIFSISSIFNIYYWEFYLKSRRRRRRYFSKNLSLLICMDVSFNTQFYTFRKKKYATGFLDPCVDATYIIHLKGNGRLKHIYKQLSLFQPTQIVYILHNPGYKNGKKKLKENISYCDLVDSYLQCFSHANNRNYNNILILEDDFFFSPDIKQPHIINNITHFLQSKQDSEFIYYLGCVPIFIYPYNWNHYVSYMSWTTHAIIYSKKARHKSFNIKYKHWDSILNNNIQERYMYHRPLCLQTFTYTENQKNWIDKQHCLYTLCTLYKDLFLYIFQMNTYPEFGFFFIYLNAKYALLFNFLGLILVIFILYFLLIYLITNYHH